MADPKLRLLFHNKSQKYKTTGRKKRDKNRTNTTVLQGGPDTKNPRTIFLLNRQECFLLALYNKDNNLNLKPHNASTTPTKLSVTKVVFHKPHIYCIIKKKTKKFPRKPFQFLRTGYSTHIEIQNITYMLAF